MSEIVREGQTPTVFTLLGHLLLQLERHSTITHAVFITDIPQQQRVGLIMNLNHQQQENTLPRVVILKAENTIS